MKIYVLYNINLFFFVLRFIFTGFGPNTPYVEWKAIREHPTHRNVSWWMK